MGGHSEVFALVAVLWATPGVVLVLMYGGQQLGFELLESLLRLTILQVKIVHTLIFVILSGCVLLVLYSGIVGSITNWTWVAVGLILLEGVTLVAFGGKCPLTLVAERLGASQGAVVDIFLPKWLADRIFPICGTTFLVGCILLSWRLWRG